MVAYLVIQVVLAFAATTRERPARFGWQMYSYPGYITLFSYETADGPTEKTLDELATHARVDIHDRLRIAAWLCDTQATPTVSITRLGETETVPCG